MSVRTQAWLIWLAIAVQVLLTALAVLFDGLRAWPSLGVDFWVGALLGKVITLLVFPVVGAVIFSQRPQHPIGKLFCVLNLGWTVNNCAGSYVRYAFANGGAGLPSVDLAVWAYFWPGIISTSLLILLVLLFPDGTLLSPRWRPFVRTVIGMAVVGAVCLAFAPGPIDPSIGVQVNNPAGISGPVGEVLGAVGNILQVFLLPLFGVAAVSMILRLRRARGQERQQLKWFTTGFALEALLVLVTVPLMIAYASQGTAPLWAQIIMQGAILGTALVPIAAGMAILKYRLYDIDVLINRTLVYGSLTALLAAVYWGGVVAFQTLLRPVVGEGNDLAIVATTLLIAALFLPLRRTIQRFIDRRFYRRKYDAVRTLEQFGQVARDEVDLGALTGRLMAVVDDTMQPEHISLWLRQRPEADGRG